MNAITKTNGATLLEQVITKGDLSNLSDLQLTEHYAAVCKSCGLNPLTQPFAYLHLNGRKILYALRSCTDQLRTIHKISVEELTETERDGVFIVTAKVRNAEGRTDMAKGAVTIANLKGDALANALMKAETKAKRRATLSICGLGFVLDETDIETIPEATTAPKERMQTLPKKDCRGVYTKLQTEMDVCTSRESLKAWGEASAERIKVMPLDWQEILRLRYEEAMLAFRQKEMQETSGVKHDADGVIWDDDGVRPATAEDKPADDGLDIPASLRRVERPKPRVVLTKAQQMILDIRELPPKECLQWGLKHHDAYQDLNAQEQQEIADALLARTLNGSATAHRG